MVRRCFSALLIVVNGLLAVVNSMKLLAQEVENQEAHHGVILQYHHVADNTPAATSVTPQQFRHHMELLRQGGFRVWPLPKLVHALQNELPIPDKTVAITVDDAYLDVYQNAAPILRQFGYPFTLFVSTDPVDQKLPGFLNWEQLRELKNQGAQLANHSQSHPHLLRKREAERDQAWLSRIKTELDVAEARLQQETGENWKYFAFPYGEVDEVLQQAIQDWGYIGFGQQSGAVNKKLLLSGAAPRYPFNESYVNEASFLLKAGSLPLPVLEIKSDPTVWDQAGKPKLQLTLAKEVSGMLNCFASGQGQIQVHKTADRVFTVQANNAIPVGRSRYNCTLPVAGMPGRFHWYSKTWIRKRDDGSWYQE